MFWFWIVVIICVCLVHLSLSPGSVRVTGEHFASVLRVGGEGSHVCAE